jgi:DNA-binding PadR family transcriptional regulator
MILNKSYLPILGLLALKPMSGYEIRTWITEYLSFFWTEGWGQIYPALKELEAEGAIERVEGESQGKREKRVYRLLEAGRLKLSHYLASPPQPSTLRSELLLRVFFGAFADERAIRLHLEGELARLKSEEACREFLEANALASPCNDPAVTRYWAYALLYGRMQAWFQIEWCERVLEDMAAGGASTGAE